MDEILTVPQMARYLKLSKSKLYYLVQAGRIRHIRIGRSVRIRVVDMQQWIADQMSDGTAGCGSQASGGVREGRSR
jgi:excisionase family DNA binding protein